MTAARVVAQAKINLALRVLAREANGFHQIETLFQRLDVGDDIVVRADVSGRALDCRGADTGPVERNLAWRAATLYAEAAGWPTGFAIEIEKRIPVGAGLGGGSADAAAVLRALDALAPSPLPSKRLVALAFALGADVPFLLSDAVLALAWGRGERLLALRALPPRPVVLLTPPVPVATADAYAWLRASPPPPPRPALLEVADLGDWRGVAALAHNDFAAPVAARVPAVARLLAALPALADSRRTPSPGAGSEASDAGTIHGMSGSGSTCFVVLDDGQPVDEARFAGEWTMLWTRSASAVVGVVRIG